MKHLIPVVGVMALLACGGKKSDDSAASGSGSSASAAAGALTGLTGPLPGRKPAAKTLKLEGKLPDTAVKAMAEAALTAKKEAKPAKKHHARKSKKGNAKGEGVFVAAVPRAAAKQGKGKVPKADAKAKEATTRPAGGKIIRTAVHADGTFALVVPAADYVLVFLDDDDEWFGALSFPTAVKGKSTPILPGSHGPLKAGDVYNVNFGSIDVNLDAWTFEPETNPFTLFDIDGDGQSDFADADDDGDGVSDDEDLDDDGDGLDDAAFDFDADDDGQLDGFDDDDDNDGIDDDKDTDDDGDGADDKDDDSDGDGVEDVAEDDTVDDADGDGTADDADNDDDNDGVLDDKDNDDDNDGMPDVQEASYERQEEAADPGGDDTGGN